MPFTADYVASSLARLHDAREIAENLRHDKAAHQAAMNAVFALEDCHEAFLQIRAEARHLVKNAAPDSCR